MDQGQVPSRSTSEVAPSSSGVFANTAPWYFYFRGGLIYPVRLQLCADSAQFTPESESWRWVASGKFVAGSGVAERFWRADSGVSGLSTRFEKVHRKELADDSGQDISVSVFAAGVIVVAGHCRDSKGRSAAPAWFFCRQRAAGLRCVARIMNPGLGGRCAVGLIGMSLAVVVEGGGGQRDGGFVRAVHRGRQTWFTGGKRS